MGPGNHERCAGAGGISGHNIKILGLGRRIIGIIKPLPPLAILQKNIEPILVGKGELIILIDLEIVS